MTKLLYTLAGLLLLGVALHDVDGAAVVAHVVGAGWGVLAVLAVSAAVFAVDTVTWQMALPVVRLDGRWFRRLFQVRLAGEAYNQIVPAGTMGGEPLKSVLLARHYGLPYGEVIASQVASRTVNLLALLPFLLAGLVLMEARPGLPAGYAASGAAALGLLGACIAGCFAVQRWRLSSRLGRWIGQRRQSARVGAAIAHLDAVEIHIVRFYTAHRGRFLGAFVLSFGQWWLGALEVYVTMTALGHPVTLMDAWIIEAVVQLVRAGTFFIPASLGSQEAAFLVLITAIAGAPALGIAAAVLRRARELLWIAWGVATGAAYAARRPAAPGKPPHRGDRA